MALSKLSDQMDGVGVAIARLEAPAPRHEHGRVNRRARRIPQLLLAMVFRRMMERALWMMDLERAPWRRHRHLLRKIARMQKAR